MTKSFSLLKSFGAIFSCLLLFTSLKTRNQTTLFTSIRDVSDTLKPGKCDGYISIENYNQLPLSPRYSNSEEAVFWNSPTAKPGDFVLLKGAFDTATHNIILSLISAAASTKSKSIPTQVSIQLSQSTSTGLGFQIPKDFPTGAYAIRLQPNKNIIARINIPLIYWMISKNDNLFTKSLFPGDSLFFFGENIPKKGELLIDGSRQSKIIPFLSRDEKSAVIVLPQTLTPGKFNMQISSDFRVSSDTFKIIIDAKTVTHNIHINCSKLVGDDMTDNSNILQNYINENRDSTIDLILNIPKGIFKFSKPIILGVHEYLKGAGKKETILKGFTDTDENTPLSWITGQHDFGLESLTFLAPVRSSLLSNFSSSRQMPRDALANKGNIFLKNILLKCTNHSDQYGSIALATTLVNLIGKNIMIINSEFDNSERTSSVQVPKFNDNTALTVFPVDGCIIEKNIFKLGDWGVGLYLKSYKNVIVSNNLFEGITQNPGAACGISLWSTMDLGNSENIFISSNTIANMKGNNREALTTDGGGGTYYGVFRSSNEFSSILATIPVWAAANRQLLPNTFAALITAGRGVGQISFIKSFNKDTIYLSTPWKIQPDSESVVTIFLPQNHIQIVRNSVSQSGPIQFFGSVTNSEISENHFYDSWGINLYSGIYFCACEPLANITISDNILTGRSVIALKKNAGLCVSSSPIGIVSGISIKNNSVTGEGTLAIAGKRERVFPLLSDKNLITNTITAPQK